MLYVKQMWFGMLMQTAQICTQKFSSLQSDLRTWHSRICDSVEVLTKTFMNFLFAIWIHRAEICAGRK